MCLVDVVVRGGGARRGPRRSAGELAVPCGFGFLLFFKTVGREPNSTHGTPLSWAQFSSHDKELFAVKLFVVSPAESISRQTLCREHSGLCREYQADDNLPVSGRKVGTVQFVIDYHQFTTVCKQVKISYFKKNKNKNIFKKCWVPHRILGSRF